LKTFEPGEHYVETLRDLAQPTGQVDEERLRLLENWPCGENRTRTRHPRSQIYHRHRPHEARTAHSSLTGLPSAEIRCLPVPRQAISHNIVMTRMDRVWSGHVPSVGMQLPPARAPVPFPSCDVCLDRLLFVSKTGIPVSVVVLFTCNQWVQSAKYHTCIQTLCTAPPSQRKTQ
jgi:hypothetical protein